MTSVPYWVLDEAHWIFRGFGLLNGYLSGENTLHERVAGGTSNHEAEDQRQFTEERPGSGVGREYRPVKSANFGTSDSYGAAFEEGAELTIQSQHHVR